MRLNLKVRQAIAVRAFQQPIWILNIWLGNDKQRFVNIIDSRSDWIRLWLDTVSA